MIYIHTFSWYEIALSEKCDWDFHDPLHMPEFHRPRFQDHGTSIHTLTRENVGLPFSHCDGVYTELENTWIGSLTADCPILIIMGQSECAVVHSGWRGTKSGIWEQALRAFSTSRESLRVMIGPHIMGESYEVQSDFLEHFPKEYFTFRHERIFFSLTQVLLHDLIALWIKREHIFIDTHDTFLSNNFHSYRREKTWERWCFAVRMKSIPEW